MTGIKSNQPKGFRRIKALANGEKLVRTDDSGDVDIGRLFEARIVGFVKDSEGKKQKEYKSKEGDLAYIYKIRILEKSDETTIGNEFLPNPLDFAQMTALQKGSNMSIEELKNTILNLHPEGVFVQHGDATEVPKINDAVIASSEKIQGRFIITKKVGTMAMTDGGYEPQDSPTKFDDERSLVNFGGNGEPVSNYPQVFLKDNSVKWNCLDPDVKKGVLEIAEKTGLPITVTAGYRSKEQNDKVGSSDNSQHRYGQAVDIRTRDKTNEELHLIEEAARQVGFKKPPPLAHGTAEHFHFEYPANKNQISEASEECAEKIAAAFKADPAGGTPKV
jgi:hypothetical protein